MPISELANLLHRLAEPEIRDLLATSVGNPTPDKLQMIAETYSTEPSWVFLGFEDRERGVIAIIGVEQAPHRRGIVRHIAVANAARRQGIGRRLLFEAAARLGLTHLEAETDSESSGFYERCGFSVRSLGEKYPGTERFHCMLSLAAGAAQQGAAD